MTSSSLTNTLPNVQFRLDPAPSRHFSPTDCVHAERLCQYLHCERLLVAMATLPASVLPPVEQRNESVYCQRVNVLSTNEGRRHQNESECKTVEELSKHCVQSSRRLIFVYSGDVVCVSMRVSECVCVSCINLHLCI